MALLIGTDEAGYGPNLGPLVVAATVWQVDDAALTADLYEVLSDSVSAQIVRDGRLPIADSKLLYKPGKGLSELERGVLAALQLTGHRPRRWRSLLAALDAKISGQLSDVPWYRDFDCDVPIDADAKDLVDEAATIETKWQRSGVRLVEVCAATTLPYRFNQLVDEHGTKGAALSHVTLQLTSNLVSQYSRQPTLISCDKHGGRNKYMALLQHFFPDESIQFACEGRAKSEYNWGDDGARTTCRFVAKGESFLPSALASMTAKYVREVCMRAFNAYWHEHVPGIRPTAGYPEDAKRFRAEIAAKQRTLKISDDLLWRRR